MAVEGVGACQLVKLAMEVPIKVTYQGLSQNETSRTHTVIIAEQTTQTANLLRVLDKVSKKEKFVEMLSQVNELKKSHQRR